MTAPHEPPPRSKAGSKSSPNSVRAGVGGVGGGTGLVAIAQSLGPGSTVGAILLYAAPAVSVVIGTSLFYLEVQATRYLERRLVNNARRTLERQLASPDGDTRASEPSRPVSPRRPSLPRHWRLRHARRDQL